MTTPWALLGLLLIPVLILLGGLLDTLRRGVRAVGVPQPWLVSAFLALLLLLALLVGYPEEATQVLRLEGGRLVSAPEFATPRR